MSPGGFLNTAAMREGVSFSLPPPYTLQQSVSADLIACMERSTYFAVLIHNIYLSFHFLINIPEIILDDLVDSMFYFSVVLFIRELFRSPCDPSKISTSIVAFFHIEQKPGVELFEWIKWVIGRCQPALLLHEHSTPFIISISTQSMRKRQLLQRSQMYCIRMHA